MLVYMYHVRYGSRGPPPLPQMVSYWFLLYRVTPLPLLRIPEIPKSHNEDTMGGGWEDTTMLHIKHECMLFLVFEPTMRLTYWNLHIVRRGFQYCIWDYKQPSQFGFTRGRSTPDETSSRCLHWHQGSLWLGGSWCSMEGPESDRGAPPLLLQLIQDLHEVSAVYVLEMTFPLPS